MKNKNAIIRTEDITKRFGVTTALDKVSIDIAEGDILAIMGPSGSGKTTLLHCIAGILTPDSGKVFFNDQDLGRLKEDARTRLRREQFGFVFQFGQLVPELTALENAALPLLLGGVSRKEAFARAEPWFEALGIAGLEGRRAGELSGGQAQRVALAHAFAQRPQVLFADEPTGALDTLAGEQVMELLTGVARKEGMTVVIVTHDARVAAYADSEIIVRDGKIAATSGALHV